MQVNKETFNFKIEFYFAYIYSFHLIVCVKILN